MCASKFLAFFFIIIISIQLCALTFGLSLTNNTLTSSQLHSVVDASESPPFLVYEIPIPSPTLSVDEESSPPVIDGEQKSPPPPSTIKIKPKSPPPTTKKERKSPPPPVDNDLNSPSPTPKNGPISFSPTISPTLFPPAITNGPVSPALTADGNLISPLPTPISPTTKGVSPPQADASQPTTPDSEAIYDTDGGNKNSRFQVLATVVPVMIFQYFVF